MKKKDKSDVIYLDFIKAIKQFDDGEYESVGFIFAFSSTFLKIKEDKWLYSIESFIAEVGGSLGLFLGFSFLGIWDIITAAIYYFFKK